MGSGPDALATGLLCVDNLTLIEHIGKYPTKKDKMLDQKLLG